jgi:hypothetical protein
LKETQFFTEANEEDFASSFALFPSVHLQIQNNPELSEIIMEINDLQKTSLDNQPLAQTMLEINDFRRFATYLSPPFLFFEGVTGRDQA